MSTLMKTSTLGSHACLGEALRVESRTAVAQVRVQIRDGIEALPRVHRSPVLLLLALTALGGIVGDAWTTAAMMSTGLFEEANPAAALGMGWIGVTGWAVLASLVCAALAVVTFGSAPGLYARTVRGMCVLVMAGKVWLTPSATTCCGRR